MILKKPYAFLIKYFKLINFIICGLSIYISYKSYNIISFFNEYINNNYTGNYYEGFFNNYISPFTILFLILIIVSTIVIIFLFIYKKKPIKAYVTSVIYYVILFIFIMIIKNVMITLEETLITAEASRIYRDFSIILFIPQIFLILMYLFRGFGINIKKFNFDEDLKQLKIEAEDNEEIELTLKGDNVKLKRNINRFIREFKYYVKENKFVVSIIALILLVILAITIFNAMPEIIDQKYNQGDIFSINNLTYNIEDSIITNLDYNGNIISKDKYYLVVKLNIVNNTNYNSIIDYNIFRLKINDTYIYPLLDKVKFFIDYAKDDYKKEIKPNNKTLIPLIYEITESDLRKSYEIKISNGNTFIDNIFVGKHNYITITPVVMNKVNTEFILKENEEVNFSNSNLGNTKITLSNFIITDKYLYDYESCINDVCNTYKDIISVDYRTNNATLIVMDYKSELDYSMPFYTHTSNINSIVSSFMKVKYKDDNNKLVYANVKDFTSQKLKNKLVVETTNKINDSSEVYISFIVRNKEYLVKVK